MKSTSESTVDPNRHRGAAAGGVGLGAETSRCYLSEDVPSGSRRSVEKWLRSLIGRDDIRRIWMKPIGSKQSIWHHEGPLAELPDIGVLFEADPEESLEIAA